MSSPSLRRSRNGCCSARGPSVTYLETTDERYTDFDHSFGEDLSTKPVISQDEPSYSSSPLFSNQTSPEDRFFDLEFLELASRVFCIFVTLVILVAVLPMLLLLAVALQIDSPGKLFFAQQRVGKDGRLFRCLKFRTMCTDADAALTRHLANSEAARREWAATFKLQDDPRVTALGRVVRKLSLDEFPQLINILRGEMSLVGPRPIVEQEIPLYGRYFADYCKVRPGLTGLWQVSGRNDTSYRRRVCIDSLYVRRRSLAFDLAILARTVPAVIGAKGSY